MLAARLRICIYFESLIEIPSIEKNDIFLKKPRLHLLTSPKYFYYGVYAVEFVPYEIAGNFCLAASHSHKKGARLEP